MQANRYPLICTHPTNIHLAHIRNPFHHNPHQKFLNRFIRIVCFNEVMKVLIKTYPVTHIWATTFRDRLGWSLDHVWWLIHPDEMFLYIWMIWSYTWLRLYVAPASLFMALFTLRLIQIYSLIQRVNLSLSRWRILESSQSIMWLVGAM